MEKFSVLMPAELSKSQDGEWVVEGLASTSSIDRQGEIIDQAGMDLTPVDQGKGWFNWDHAPGIENLLGTIDSYRKTSQGLFVKGRLLKNKEKAKAVYEVMSSLNKAEDKARMGMSVEGRILQRDAKNPKRIIKCVIDKVALTLAPVNTDTYATLAKSMGYETQESLIKSLTESDIEFNSPEVPTESLSESNEQAMFTATQVVQIIQKALGVGSGAIEAPASRSGGDAIQVSNMSSDNKDKKDDKPETNGEEIPFKKKLKKLNKSEFQKSMIDALDQLQTLYPQIPRLDLWKALQNRIETKF
jgi:hypothetical protein